MTARHARHRRWALRRRRTPPELPHRLDHVAESRERLLVALRALGATATLYGSRGLIVSHRRTSPRPRLISLRYHPEWGRLAWCWVHNDHVDALGHINDVDMVATRVVNALSGGSG